MSEQSRGNSGFCVVAAINDDEILERNLLKSPDVGTLVPFYPVRGASSAACAYNQALRKCDAEFVVFAHQDVYLPKNWFEKVRGAISGVIKSDPDWAVLGIFGVTPQGRYVGRVWSTGLCQEIVYPVRDPIEVGSIDELVIILRKSAGICFDEELPGFHLYGTDIVQIARAAGKGAYVIEAPVIHNSRPVRTLLGPYFRSARFMGRKWHHQLPLQTPCARITRHCFRLYLSECKSGIVGKWRRRSNNPVKIDPVGQARMLGYE